MTGKEVSVPLASKIYDAAELLLELAYTVKTSKDSLDAFIAAALLLADDYLESITDQFLSEGNEWFEYSFTKDDNGIYTLDDASFDFQLWVDEFGLWQTNVEIAGRPLVLKTKEDLVITVEWLEELHDNEELEDDE